MRSSVRLPRWTSKATSALTCVPAETHSGSSARTRVPGEPDGAPAASVTTGWLARSTEMDETIMELPRSAVAGLLGQARNTTSHTCWSGVNVTFSVPAMDSRSSETVKARSTTGREVDGAV